MCPVPKSNPESPEKEEPPLPVANVDVSNVLDSTVASANIIHNNLVKPSSEELLNIEPETKIRYRFSSRIIMAQYMFLF